MSKTSTGTPPDPRGKAGADRERAVSYGKIAYSEDLSYIAYMGHVSGHLFTLLHDASGGQVTQAKFHDSPQGLLAALEVGSMFGVPRHRVVETFLQDFVDRAELRLYVDVYDPYRRER